MIQKNPKHIILLLLCVIFLLVFVLWNWGSIQNRNFGNGSPTPTPYAQSSLYFAPDKLILKSGSTALQTVVVMLTPQLNDVTGVQLEISYDPQFITNVHIANGSLFTHPLIFSNKVDPKNRQISFSYVITPSQKPVNKKGSVAIITFNPTGNLTATNGHTITETRLQFLSKTEITARGVNPSVLMPQSLNNILSVYFTK